MRWCFEGLVLLACRVLGLGLGFFLGLIFLGLIKKFYRKKVTFEKLFFILLYIVKVCIPP